MSNEEYFNKWKEVYDALILEETSGQDGEGDESIRDLNFENVAIGVFMAYGMPYSDALTFYHQVCVQRKVF